MSWVHREALKQPSPSACTTSSVAFIRLLNGIPAVELIS